MANSMNSVTDEEYSMTMADDFVQRRNERPIPRFLPALPITIGWCEHAIQVVFGEQPAEYPVRSSEFTAKRESLEKALQDLNAKRGLTAMVAPASASKIVPAFWRMLREMRLRLGPAWRRLLR